MDTHSTDSTSMWKTYLLIAVLMVAFCPRMETHTSDNKSFLLNPNKSTSSNTTATIHPYFEQYRHWAEANQAASGVPSAITLAQGFLESERGESGLAKDSHNHFGVKCHKAWKGKRVYKDDDSVGECFRRYGSAFESFQDHSRFLKQNRRYAPLFDLEITDIEGWAHGLKKAGYATDSLYAQKLLKIVRKYGL